MSDYENDDQCWSALESFRVKLISVIDPSRITPYLRQCKVLNPDDEEQVLSDPNLVIRKRKVGEGCSHTSRPQSFTIPTRHPGRGCCMLHSLPWTCPTQLHLHVGYMSESLSPSCHVYLLLPSGGRGVPTIVQALREPPE